MKHILKFLWNLKTQSNPLLGTTSNTTRAVVLLTFKFLIIAYTHKCCEGHYARILNDQRSAINYILLSNGLVDHVERVFIEESGSFDLHSDHVIIRIVLRNIVTTCKNIKICKDFWKINCLFLKTN